MYSRPNAVPSISRASCRSPARATKRSIAVAKWFGMMRCGLDPGDEGAGESDGAARGRVEEDREAREMLGVGGRAGERQLEIQHHVFEVRTREALRKGCAVATRGFPSSASRAWARPSCGTSVQVIQSSGRLFANSGCWNSGLDKPRVRPLPGFFSSQN